ncbi:MAG: glycosyltransferase family 4 protein [Acidimicrobiales bacterium]
MPFDRRVWQEASTLQDNGYAVHVICPRSAEDPLAHEVVDGVHIHRYKRGFEARGRSPYIVEYSIALWAMAWNLFKVLRRADVDVIQACNPPDLMFLVALPFVWTGRRAFIFDHHDLSPELMEAKGSAAGSLVVRLLTWCEARSFALATVSIATNESYRQVAIERGRMDPEEVFVVRSGPDLKRFAAAMPDEKFRNGKRHLIAYVGVMGAQDGVDLLLDAMHVVRHEFGRLDIQLTLAGKGPEFPRLSQRPAQEGLDECVQFLGRVSDEELASLLASADVCVNPDVVNPFNDKSTMNKIMEYMALGRPIVMFETTEGRRSAGAAGVYVEANNSHALAQAFVELMDDPVRRHTMGAAGQKRLESELSWEYQVPHLLRAYARAVEKTEERSGRRVHRRHHS